MTHVSQGLGEEGGALPGKVHPGRIRKIGHHGVEEEHVATAAGGGATAARILMWNGQESLRALCPRRNPPQFSKHCPTFSHTGLEQMWGEVLQK